MAKIINIESHQHKKEHFVYLNGEKIAVHPLGTDMSKYENMQNVTIYALKGWYYISLVDKAMIEEKPVGSEAGKTNTVSLKPRDTRLGF